MAPHSPTVAPSPYTPAFWIVSAAHFCFLMGFWMFVLLPLHLATLGASESRIGVLVAIEPAAAVLIRPMLGGLLLRRGRMWVIRHGGIVNVAAVALYLVVTDLDVGMAAVRVLHGFGIGALFTSFFTYLTDIAPAERRTEAIAVFGISAMVPTALAPLLGEELILRFGFAALFAAAAAFSLASVAFAALLAEPEAAGEATQGSFWGLAAARRLRGVWMTTLVFALAMSSYMTFLAPFGHSRGLTRVGLFFLCYSLAAAGLRIVGRRIPDRFGPRRVLVPALASFTAGLYVLSDVGSSASLAVAGVLCGIGHGYLFPILSGLAVENTDRGSRGSAMALFTAVFDLGHMVGPAVFGVVAETFGYPGMFLSAAAVVGSTLLYWVRRLEVRS